MRHFHALLLLLIAAIVAVGCGGGGGGGGAASAQARVFMTDNLGSYDHVWVTVKEVDLIGAGGTQVIFADAIGKTVDLASLHAGGVGKFAFLGLKSVPAGTYSQIKFVLSDSLVIFPNGSPVGLNRTFAGSSGGVAILTLGLASPSVSGQTDMVCDFDLSTWSDDGVHVTGSIGVGSSSGLDDPSRHEPDEFEGRLSNLQGTAPNFTFDLTRGSGSPVHVQTTSSTLIFNNDGTPNPTLANGERVEVHGIFDVTANALVVTRVKIQHAQEGGGEAEAHGVVALVGAGSFTLTVNHCDAFVPGNTTITVVPSASARFMSDSGVVLTSTEFFALLAPGVHVEAKGSFDLASNTLTADRLKIEHDHDGGGGGGGHEANVKGAPSALNAAAGTFDVTVAEWEGASLTVGQVVHVTTNGSTEFKAANGDTLTSAAFFLALATASGVEAEGTLTDSTLAATEVRIKSH